MIKHDDIPAGAKPRRLLRKLSIAAAVLLVLLVGGWFVLTSAAFFKGVILPRVGASMNADVSVSDAAIQPFKQVILRDFKLQAHGEEVFFTASEIRCRYSLFDMLGGTLTVDEAMLKSPRIHYILKPDGTSNLDPLLQQAPGKHSAPAKAPAKTSGLPQLNIRSLTIENAAILYAAADAAGNRTSVELDDASLVLKDLRNNSEGSLELGALLKANLTSAATNALFQAKIAGQFRVGLDANAMPKSIQGGTTFTITDARGALADLATFAAALDCRMSETEIQDLSLTAAKGPDELGKLRVSGPFSAARGEGRLAVELSGMDYRLLNLAGAAFGLEFGNSVLASTNTLVLQQHGSDIALTGQFLARDFAVRQNGRSTPAIQVRSAYDLAVHAASQTLALRVFELDVSKQQQPLLQGRLSSPLTVKWGAGGEGMGDAELNFKLTDLDLQDFRAFTGSNLLGGVVQGSLALKSTGAGRILDVTVSATGDRFSVRSGAQTLTGFGFNLQSAVSVENTDRFRIDQAELALTHDGRSALVVRLGGSGSLARPSVTLNAGMTAHLRELNAWLPASKFSLPDETLEVQLSLDAVRTNRVVTLNRAVLSLGPTPRAKNELTLTGRVDLTEADATGGQLRLAAEALDVTRYYELFERLGSTAARTEAPATAPAQPETEPEAMQLPLKSFLAELSVGHLYLREVDIADWQASLRLDGGRVTLRPCRLALNGAPVHADLELDLAVPGWTYQVEAGVEAVAVAPLVNSFLPDRKGQFSGTADAVAQIQGAGVTGASLQEHLTGQFNLGATNLAFVLDNARSKLVRTLADVLFTLPDLVRNPSGAAAGRLLGAVLGGDRAVDAGGWASKIKGSPVNVITLRGTAGNGRVRVEEAFVQSTAYLARTSGDVTLAAVLTNSTLRFPVELSLSREVAAKAGLLPADTPTNAAYAKLPDFLTLQGSLGNPKPKINYLALTTLATQSGANLTGGTGNKDLDKTSGILGAVGGLLGGGSTGSTNVASEAASTNAPSPAPKLRDLFKPQSN